MLLFPLLLPLCSEVTLLHAGSLSVQVEFKRLWNNFVPLQGQQCKFSKEFGLFFTTFRAHLKVDFLASELEENAVTRRELSFSASQEIVNSVNYSVKMYKNFFPDQDLLHQDR